MDAYKKLVLEAEKALNDGDEELANALLAEAESMSGQQQSGATQENYNPIDDMSGGERFLAGVGKGAVDTASGFTGLLGFHDPFSLGNRQAADKKLLETEAGQYGDLTGNIAATLPAMFIPGANTLKGSTLVGAGIGALGHDADLAERLKSGAVGAAGGAIGGAIPYTGKIVSKALAPFGGVESKRGVIADFLSKELGDNADMVAARLEGFTPSIPGSIPTAAEAGGSGLLAAVQRFAEQANPEQYAFRRQQNALARRSIVDGIAGTEQDMAAALAAREQATKDAYAAIHDQFVQSNPLLERLLATDAGQTAVANARKLASNEYRAFGEPVPQTIPPEMSSVADELAAVAGNAAPHWTQQPINHETDNLLTAIRKLGGINKELAQSTYGNEMWRDGLGNGLFRNQGGQSLDDLAARLAEHGYLPEGSGPYELVDALYKGGADSMYSSAKSAYDDVLAPSMTQADDLNARLDKLVTALENKGKPATASAKPEVSPYDKAYYGKDLHNIQRVLRDLSTNPATDPVARHSIRGVYDDYVSELERSIPGLLDVNQNYAALSKPINQMEIGRALAGKVNSALSDFGPYTRETAETFARSLRDLDSTAAKATGYKNAKAADILTPQQIESLNNVAEELNRKAMADELGRGVGSNTFQNFAMNGIAEASGIPSGLTGLLRFIPGMSSTANALHGAAGHIYKGAEKEMRDMLAEAFLDPKKTAELIRRGILDRNSVGLLDYSGQYLPAASIGLSNYLMQQ